MTETFFLSIATTGFIVAFAHAAIPTHWLPFVLAGRGQRWSKAKTLMVVALCGSGHVLFTTLLGVLVVWLGIETSKWTGTVFPWIAGGALILFGLYYFVRQMRDGGHGHSHSDHRDVGDSGHDEVSHGAHGSDGPAQETKRIDTGRGALVLEVFEDGAPPRFRVRSEGTPATLPPAEALSIGTVRPNGTRQTFSFAARSGYLESLEEIPEPHEFTATVRLSQGDHANLYEIHFEEHEHATVVQPAATPEVGQRAIGKVKSDRAVILGLFTLLTFSPC